MVLLQIQEKVVSVDNLVRDKLYSESFNCITSWTIITLISETLASKPWPQLSRLDGCNLFIVKNCHLWQILKFRNGYEDLKKI